MPARFLIVFASVLLTLPAGAFDKSHDAWTKVLSQYQTPEGLVRYKILKSDAQAKGHLFNTYLAALQALSKAEYGALSPADKKAFLINAYNALTVKLIIDNYPVASIKKIGGLFKKAWSVEFFSLLEGQVKALDPIEHEILRPDFKDYRIHAAVNCASISCPPLRHEAFVGDRLDAQLDEQMRLWLGDQARNSYDTQAGVLNLSKIFDWYKSDFESWGGGVKSVVAKHGPDVAKAALTKKGDIKYLDYDWSLNEAK